jgi:hypothetical protein
VLEEPVKATNLLQKGLAFPLRWSVTDSADRKRHPASHLADAGLEAVRHPGRIANAGDALDHRDHRFCDDAIRYQLDRRNARNCGNVRRVPLVQPTQKAERDRYIATGKD